MKSFILVDGGNIVRCMASEECNLHKDKLHMAKYHVETRGYTVGDAYFPETDTWERHPENYPQPTERERNEMAISVRIAEITRKQAIEELKEEGKLPPDYTIYPNVVGS